MRGGATTGAAGVKGHEMAAGTAAAGGVGAMATAVACGTGLAPSTTTDAATGKAAAGGTGVAPSAGTTASVRGPPKKKVKSTIVPYVDEAPTRMCFPPTQILETTTIKEKATPKSSTGTFKRTGR
ncbi:hypothetical protein ZWY2020_027283 [Hordeum vulgare]|nr:hypothetical protein ZWY2020_027283 [Hordeum vulgare]